MENQEAAAPLLENALFVNMFPLILPDQLAKATRELIAKARDATKVRHSVHNFLVAVPVFIIAYTYHRNTVTHVTSFIRDLLYKLRIIQVLTLMYLSLILISLREENTLKLFIYPTLALSILQPAINNYSHQHRSRAMIRATSPG